MKESSLVNDVTIIAEKFIRHLESLERMVDYSELIEKEYKIKKDNDKSLGEVADLIIQVKTILNIKEINADMEMTENDLNSIKILDNMKTDNNIIRYIYNNLDVTYDDGDIGIRSMSPFVSKVVDSFLDETYNLDSDINQLLNSIIISLVTGLELLIADLFKDFIQNIDQSDFLKSKTISYSDLVKIGDVEEARIFLIDEYTEDLLKQSFKYWIDELEKRMHIKVKSIPFLNNEVEKIFEVFQRRHLLIHNNGIVNSLYLSKVDPSLTVGVEKDDSIEIDKNYIEQSINVFRRFGIVLLFKYAEKKHRQEKDPMFNYFNNLLLNPSLIKCLGTRYIYNEVFNNQSYTHSSRLIAQINYYLTYKHIGDFDTILSEVKTFDVSTLSVEFKMAKFILIDEYDLALQAFQTFCETIDDNFFILMIDWPLIKLARNIPGFTDFIAKRLDSIINIEEGEKVEV